MKELPKIYDPKEVEDKIYAMWLKGGYFKGEIDHDKEPFTIVIPPPNVTSQLHIGHACDNTLQDILIRYKRMQGFSALWVPGTDHAGIATQIKVEEKLREEGLTRHDLGREKFVERVWDWKNKYGSVIINQLKKLGSSCDWDRERFTMDEGCSKAVREVFVRLYEKDLIYKGSKIVNWCPNCVTALSDVEVEREEQHSHLWHIRYPFKDSNDYIIVATTRPETMLGDTAVAVNPEDERYRHLIGKTLILPLVNREIPLIADEYVDPDFGTGVVKITPAHDPNDFEVGLRHGLEIIRVLDDNAIINEHGGDYKDLDRDKARKAIVKDLEEKEFLDKAEEYTHNVGICYRCGDNVEPIVSAQWFVKMEPLAVNAIKAVKEGDIRFVPERFSKIYINWMENIHDWCISRQLWWGHQIPAWYCQDCSHINVSRNTPEKCENCGGTDLKQEEDVLDTWFSSALWPFSTLGWPEETPELSYFYPTSVLVTAYDIIFFWVARMIFSGLEHMGQKPFHTVFIHGLVRDAEGRKMSKSLGNGVDPLKMIDEYGADALRLNMVSGISPGNDMRFLITRCESFRNFANKLWNAARFVLMNLEIEDTTLSETLETEDKWILSELNTLIGEVTENIDNYELGVAVGKIYDFIWDSFCDWYIELTKARLQSEDKSASIRVQKVLAYVLGETLKLLHPFMPFITEEIWQSLPNISKALMVERWPEVSPAHHFPVEEQNMVSVMNVIKAVRALRAEKNVPPSRKTKLIILTEKGDIFMRGEAFLKRLAYANELVITDKSPDRITEMAGAVTEEARLFIPMSELVDIGKELERIARELKKAQAEHGKLSAKLSNPGFIAKAPEQIVAAEREKASKLLSLMENLKESASQLEKWQIDK
ncbi:MAG: valine--tRNA ligase [Clostridiales bacterium]|jgi:valyl-tRNA synthetase|nr:valine--tRNA ligase [Clostridiales bacterium]